MAQVPKQELAWLAALWIGEGSICNTVARERRDGTKYMTISVGMLDHVAVEKAAHIIRKILEGRTFTGPHHTKGVQVSYQSHTKGGVFARIHLGGPKAACVVRVIWPWLEGTLKGNDAVRCFATAGYEPLPSCGDGGFYQVQSL